MLIVTGFLAVAVRVGNELCLGKWDVSCTVIVISCVCSISEKGSPDSEGDTRAYARLRLSSPQRWHQTVILKWRFEMRNLYSWWLKNRQPFFNPMGNCCILIFREVKRRGIGGGWRWPCSNITRSQFEKWHENEKAPSTKYVWHTVEFVYNENWFTNTRI